VRDPWRRRGSARGILVSMVEVVEGVVSILVSNRVLVEGVVTMAITHVGVEIMEAAEEDIQATVVLVDIKALAILATMVPDGAVGPMGAALVGALEVVVAGATCTLEDTVIICI